MVANLNIYFETTKGISGFNTNCEVLFLATSSKTDTRWNSHKIILQQMILPSLGIIPTIRSDNYFIHILTTPLSPPMQSAIANNKMLTAIHQAESFPYRIISRFIKDISIYLNIFPYPSYINTVQT